MIKALFLVLFLSTLAGAAEFAPIWNNTIKPHEGGYSSNPKDPGNWTGGKVGSGKLLGTNRGISASVYGAYVAKQGKTIKGLTEQDCAKLYERDYFRAYHLDILKSQGIADELTDEVVNMGDGGGVKLLKQMDDGIAWATKGTYGGIIHPAVGFTPEYMLFLNSWTSTRERRKAYFDGIRVLRVKYYSNLIRKNPRLASFFDTWVKRTID